MRNFATLCKIFGISTAIMLCTGFSYAQQSLDSLSKKFDRYRTTFPQEKLYVHLAQEFYLTGETVWFKIYYVDGALHHSMDLSKVAYVEILDNNNQPLLQTKVALKDGKGDGSLFLPASLNSGNYHVRAYTQWMRNFSPEFFFHKTISIVNSFRKLEADIAKAPKPFSVQFFPEGGNLVYGLKSKVAFQGVNSNGKGIDFSGAILNGQNDTIARISPLKFGIGNFTFTPLPGELYRAVISDSLQNSQTINLPVPKTHGFVMELRDSTSDLLSINVSSNDPKTQASPNFYYVIHARQIISSTGMRALGMNKASILVSKKQLAEGISHITIFDGDLRPQCERLYFKPSEKKLLITAHTSQNEYGIRRKVILDLSASESSASDDKTSLSISILRSDSLQGNLSGDIFDYLWLSSDLKGEVESPAYYMNTNSPEVAAASDNLMLTHGWRRFGWDELLNDSKRTPLFIPEYRGHLIRGTVTDAQGKPAAGVATYLSTPGRNIQLYTSRSKFSGEVQYEMKDFWGSRKIVVQTNTDQDSTSLIKIHSPYADVFATRGLAPFTLNSNVSKTLLTRSVAMQVQDVYHADNSAKFNAVDIDSTAFYGKASETYLLDDFTRFPVMEEVMREYVPGVMVRKRKDGFHFLVLDNVRKSLFQENPLVILDGMPIFDIDKIMAFDPLKVKKLEVITNRYFLGPFTFPGVVSYTTYTGDLAGFQLDPRAVLLNYEGLQRQRIFYSPQYDTQKQRESRMPDRRNLLFWAPQVTLDKEGKQQLEFYTSDLIGNYTIVIEGLTTNGYSGSTTSSFVVKQFNN
jgi:hypothetical protein